MKRTSARILLLTLLLLIPLALLLGCVNEDTPEATEAVTTEPETTSQPSANKWADLPADEALNQLMEALESESGSDEESMENGRIDVDMTMGITMSMDGMQNSTTLPFKLTVIMDGENMDFQGNLMGTNSAMIYKDGVLYLASMDEMGETGKIKCALTPEEFATVSGIIFGTENDVDSDDLTIPELPGIADLKPSELFSSVTSELDETNGDLLITGKGFNTALSSDLAPLLQPMLEGLGLVGGGEWDENGELVTDPAATLAEVVGILRGLNEENMKLTFIFDKEGNLNSTSVDVTLSVNTEDGSKTEMSVKGSFSLKIGGQTVNAPADADAYIEENWRVIFDMETAEMLGLVPDAENCVTLSDDHALRERQILYLYNNPDELVNNGVLIHVSGYLIDTYVVDEETATNPVDIGALEGMISLRDPHSQEEDYTTVLSFQIPLSAKGEGYPEEGTLIQAKYCKLTLVEESDFGSYMYLTVASYTK